MKFFRFFIFIFFAALSTDGKAEDVVSKIERWLPHQELEDALHHYLATHNLYPFIDIYQDRFEIKFIDVIEDHRDFSTYMLGEFVNPFIPTKAIFMVTKDKRTHELFVRTLCIMEGNCMNPTLFCDVLANPSFAYFYPRAWEIFYEPDSLVYISQEPLTDGSSKQIWEFHTYYEEQDVPVYLMDDGYGGAFFTLINPESEYYYP